MIRDVARPDWVPFLDRFSREHRGWLTTIEQSDESGRTGRPQVVERPLGSLEAHVRDEGVAAITVHFAERVDDRADVRVDAPVGLRVAETERGAERGLEITTPTGSTRLTFRATALPEEVDGLAPTEEDQP
jgi:hypothetical protein